MGVRVSQVKPSNCFRLHSTPMISKHSNSYRAHLWFCDFSQQSRFLTACRRFEKLVLPPSINFDIRLSSLMIRNLQSYPTTVLHERFWRFRGGGSKHTLTLTTYFQGVVRIRNPQNLRPVYSWGETRKIQNEFETLKRAASVESVEQTAAGDSWSTACSRLCRNCCWNCTISWMLPNRRSMSSTDRNVSSFSGSRYHSIRQLMSCQTTSVNALTV